VKKCFYYKCKNHDSVILYIYAVDFDEAEFIRLDRDLFNFELDLKATEIINRSFEQNDMKNIDLYAIVNQYLKTE